MGKNTTRTVIITLAVVVLLIFLAYTFVPVVRYVFVPVTGGTKAPELASIQEPNQESQLPAAGQEQSTITKENDTAKQPSSATNTVFSNANGIVQSIEQVPENGGWINTAPLDLKELQKQNKYVLIDFWTYTCINCIRETPYTQELWDRYKDHGLVIIGVHSPEFDIERVPKSIYAAMKKANITYPVWTDADMIIWDKFGNHFWPGKYLISPQGKVVYTQFGEGNYDGEEQTIRKYLSEAKWILPDYGATTRFLEPVNKEVTPELYAGPGFLREAYGNSEQPHIGTVTTFTLPEKIDANKIYLDGTWSATHDYMQSESDGKIVLNYIANAPYIVLGKKDVPVTVEVQLDGKLIPDGFVGKDIIKKDGKTSIIIDEPRLYYPINDLAAYGRHTITFLTPQGLRFYSFTFGVY